MGEEQGDRSTLLLVYWIIYQSDQLEKWVCTGRGKLADFPKIEGSIGSLIGQRAKHFGIPFSMDLRISESGHF